jgi:hypothetical protein
MGIAIRMAGFERRDTILNIGSEQVVIEDVEFAWLYGSGFPKEGDLGLAVDRLLGYEPVPVMREQSRRAANLAGRRGAHRGGGGYPRTSGIGAAYQEAAEGGAWQANAGQQVVQELEPVSGGGEAVAGLVVHAEACERADHSGAEAAEARRRSRRIW